MTTKSNCDICSSADNLAIFENGSQWCFTPNCKSNDNRKKPDNIESKLKEGLIEGQCVSLQASRRISQRTCEFFNYQVGVDGGQSVHIANYGDAQKIRTKDKRFYWKGSVANVTLFGKQKWSGKGKTVIITEGECYPEGVEVLTREGWKEFKYLKDNDEVAQVDKDRIIRFVQPLNRVIKEVKEDLIYYRSGSLRTISTPKHNIVRVHPLTNELIKTTADDLTKKHYNIPRVGIIDNKSTLNLTDDELRLVVMISADFTIRKEGDIYGCFKKERKHKRCIALLSRLNITFSDTIDSRGYHSIYIHRKQKLDYCSKLFNHEWLGKLNNHQINVILSEVLYWDGNSVPNRDQIEYSSKEYNNATFIQTLSHLNGYVSTIIPRSNKYGKWFKVSILFNKTESSTQKGYEVIPYNGWVFCVTVPSGMILIRYKNSISIGGNCDAMAVGEAQDCRWPVVSLPNGAQSARKILQSELDWLLGYESIILCFDSDAAGQAAVEDCVDLFPPGRVKIASLSEKDANDCLMKGKFEELVKLPFNAQEYRPDGIVWGDEINVNELFKKQPRGLSLPYPALDESIRGLKAGRIYTIYAGTGNGKSTAMREIALHVVSKHPDIRIANIFLEESLSFTALSYMAMNENIPAYKIEEDPNLLTNEQKESGKHLISNMGFYRHFGSLDSKRLFNLLDYLVLGKGVKVIMLDHISLLVSGMKSESGEGERRDIDMLVTNLRSFCERTGATVVCATQLKRKEKSYSKGAEITESDARGSGAIEHISDVVFSLNVGDEEFPYDAQIKIIKNRITGFKGNADLITYNPETGRYLPKKLTDEFIDNEKRIY